MQTKTIKSVQGKTGVSCKDNIVVDYDNCKIYICDDHAEAKAYKSELTTKPSKDYSDELVYVDGKLNKSQSIRKLHRQGASNNEIAKALSIRYQFVYNVLKKDAEFNELLAEAEDE